jgi:hypothetical protein
MASLLDYLPQEILSPYSGPSFNKGPYSKEEGSLISLLKSGVPSRAYNPQQTQLLPVGPAYSAEDEGPTPFGKLHIGTRNLQQKAGNAMTSIVDAIGSASGLNQYQANILSGKAGTEGFNQPPQDAKAAQEMAAKAAQEKQAMEQQVAQIAAQQAEAKVLPKGLTPQTTLADIDTAKKEGQKSKMEVEHQVKVQEGAEAILKSGGGEKELQGWAKFTDEYDLATIGMALMAGQSGNFGTDLGLALMMGKQASDFRKDKAIAGEAAGRKEQRAEKKLAIDEFKALSAAEQAALNATDLAKYREAQIANTQEKNKLYAARTAAVGSKALGESDKVRYDKATSAAGAYLANNPKFEWGKVSEGDKTRIAKKTADVFLELQNSASASGEEFTDAEIMEIAAEEAALDSGMKEGKSGIFSIFGFGDTVYGR